MFIMHHKQHCFSFDLYTKFLVVVGIWWLFHSLSLLRLPALEYIAMVFNVVHGKKFRQKICLIEYFKS